MSINFDELNVLSLTKVNEMLTTDVNIEDEIEDLLIIAYSFGNKEANSDLKLNIEPNLKDMDNAINRKTNGKSFRERLPNDNLQRLVETETHRVFNQAIEDVGKRSGLNLNKTWVTMNDGNVRDTHDYLEGMTIPFDSKFYTFDGDSARFPSDFLLAENNVNCRCRILLTRV